MEHGLAAGDGTTNPRIDEFTTSNSNSFALPQFPGEEPLAHESTQWKEKATARLTSAGLLAVAQGHPSAAAKCIVDIDLDVDVGVNVDIHIGMDVTMWFTECRRWR